MSIAYHLAARGADVIVIERSAIACAASGKSGGFLAMDWCDGTPLMHLARRSFELHAELAEAHVGEWGYRRMTTYGGIVGASSTSASRRAGLGWVSPNISINGQLGSIGSYGRSATRCLYVRYDACGGSAGRRVAAGQRHGAAAPRWKSGGRRSRRRSARGRCGRDRNGPLVSARGAMASTSARVRAEGTQPCLRDRICNSTGGAVPRIRRGHGHDPLAGDLSPCRRHHVCVCDLERLSSPD